MKKKTIEVEYIYDQMNEWKENLIDDICNILEDFPNRRIDLDGNFRGIESVYIAEDENGYEELYLDDISTDRICMSDMATNDLFSLLDLVDLINDYQLKH